MSKLINHSNLNFRLLSVCMLLLCVCMQTKAWDSEADESGKFDDYYDRSTYFPDFVQPTQWANAEYYLVKVVGSVGGPVPAGLKSYIPNYPIGNPKYAYTLSGCRVLSRAE